MDSRVCGGLAVEVFGYLFVRHGDCSHDTAADGYPGEKSLPVQGSCHITFAIVHSTVLRWHLIWRCSAVDVCAVKFIIWRRSYVDVCAVKFSIWRYSKVDVYAV